MEEEHAEDAPASDEPSAEPDSAEPNGDEHYDRPIDKFHRSAVGSVSMAWMLGLRDVLEGKPEKEEPAMVMEAPTQPHHGNIDLVIDPEHPERSVVYVRRPKDE